MKKMRLSETSGNSWKKGYVRKGGNQDLSHEPSLLLVTISWRPSEHHYRRYVVIWQEWRRPRREGFWGVVAFTLFFVVFDSKLLIWTTETGSFTREATAVTVAGLYVLVGGTLLFRVLAHARLIANEDGLIISNPFRNDQRVAWSEIAAMRADRLLLIKRHDGKRVVAWVVQKNGFARLKGRFTESDQAIVELGKHAGRALGTGPIDFAQAWSETHVPTSENLSQ